MKLVFTEEELKKIDMAVPLAWTEKMRDLSVENLFYYVWDYNKDILGEPLNLAEKFFAKFDTLPHLLSKAD